MRLRTNKDKRLMSGPIPQWWFCRVLRRHAWRMCVTGVTYDPPGTPVKERVVYQVCCDRACGTRRGPEITGIKLWTWRDLLCFGCGNPKDNGEAHGMFGPFGGCV